MLPVDGSSFFLATRITFEAVVFYHGVNNDEQCSYISFEVDGETIMSGLTCAPPVSRQDQCLDPEDNAWRAGCVEMDIKHTLSVDAALVLGEHDIRFSAQDVRTANLIQRDLIYSIAQAPVVSLPFPAGGQELVCDAGVT